MTYLPLFAFKEIQAGSALQHDQPIGQGNAYFYAE